MFIRFIVKICGTFSNRSGILSTKYKPTVSNTRYVTTGTVSERADLNISQSCVDRLKKIAPKGAFLRVIIDGGGCSGFQYRFDLDTKTNDDDICIEKDGAKIVIDSISLDFVKGATIEYHEELIRSAFRIIDNPKADINCSCGTSFSIKSS